MGNRVSEDIREVLRTAIQDDERSYYRLAKDCGVSHTVLIRFVAGERDIVLGTAGRICRALGLKLKKE